MQKKLIVLAIAGLASTAAFAQSNVTISGTIRAGVENHKRSDLAAETRVTDQSSELAFSGVEDLGGGLKAWFRLAQRFSIDEGNTTDGRNFGISGFGLGNSGIGLEGNFGKITLGRWDLHYNNLAGIENSKVFSLQALVGHGLMSQVAGSTIAAGTRSSNVFMYDTPNMSGFVGTLALSANPFGNEGGCGNNMAGLAAAAVAAGALAGANATPACGDNPSRGGAVNARVTYNNGPITAGYSYWNAKLEGSTQGATIGTGDQRGDSAWGRYSFANGFKVGLGWNRSASTTTTAGKASRNAWMLPVAYETGAHNFTFTYAKAGDVSGGFTAAVAPVAGVGGVVGTGGDTGAKVWKLGYDYTLSKRTAVGVHYIKMDNESKGAYNLFNTGAASVAGSSNVGAATLGQDQRQWYAGINHNF